LDKNTTESEEYPAVVVNKPAAQIEVAVIDTWPLKQIVTDCVRESICSD
jgi:hypothetical protein